MYRIAVEALALARRHGTGMLLKRALSAHAWRRMAYGGFQTRDWKAVLAKQLLHGEGLEIGALHNPLKVGNGARVKYLDRFDVRGLRAHYPELRDLDLVPVDIVDDGELLRAVPAASQDFIIASHFIEHCENPLGTIRTHLNRLKPGGVLFYAVPEKRMTFDRKRPNTSFAHLVADDVEGPQASREDHYREWAKLVLGKQGNEIAQTAGRLLNARVSIHFHCWDRSALASFFGLAREYLDNRFAIARIQANGPETVVVLSREA